MTTVKPAAPINPKRKAAKKCLGFIRLPLWIILLVFISQSCNTNFYLGNLKKAEKNYEIADVYYSRAVTDEPDNAEFVNEFEENAKIVSDELLERYRRYIEERRQLPAFFILQRAKKYNYNREYIEAEEKKWRRILIAGQVQFEFDSLSAYAPGSTKAEITMRFNTPVQNRRLEAEINILNGIYFVEDYLYEPQDEFLMFYTLNSVGIKESVSINGVSNRINLKFDSPQGGGAQGGRSRYEKPVQTGNLLVSNDFRTFIDFSFPVLSEVTGSLTPNNRLPSFDRFYPADVLRQNAGTDIYGGENIRFTANLQQNRIVIASSSSFIDFMPQIMFTNADQNRVFLDYGQIELTLEPDSGLWHMNRQIPDKPQYREQLLNNVILRPYLLSIDGAYPFVKNS